MSKIHQYIHANTWYNDNGQMSFCVILIRKRENPEDTQPKAAEPCWQGLCQPQSHEQFAHATHIHTPVRAWPPTDIYDTCAPRKPRPSCPDPAHSPSLNQSSSAPAVPQAKTRTSLMLLLLSDRADWTVFKQTWGPNIFISSSITSKARHRTPPPLWFGHRPSLTGFPAWAYPRITLSSVSQGDTAVPVKARQQTFRPMTATWNPCSALAYLQPLTFFMNASSIPASGSGYLFLEDSFSFFLSSILKGILCGEAMNMTLPQDPSGPTLPAPLLLHHSSIWCDTHLTAIRPIWGFTT